MFKYGTRPDYLDYPLHIKTQQERDADTIRMLNSSIESLRFKFKEMSLEFHECTHDGGDFKFCMHPFCLLARKNSTERMATDQDLAEIQAQLETVPCDPLLTLVYTSEFY